MDKNLDFLIEYLLAERGEILIMPKTQADKWRLFRSLVNVREPKEIGADFLTAQDAFLQAAIKEKRVTDIAEMRPVSKNIFLWRGDITTLKADAIVNAANSQMLGCFIPCHTCIDNAIHTYMRVFSLD